MMPVLTTRRNTKTNPMSKASGSTRMVRPTSKSKEQNRSYYNEQIASGKADAKLSYFSEKTGAYMLFMFGHSHSKNINDSDAEIEAGIGLADNGICITLTPEGDGYEMYATHSKVDKEGNTTYKYSEGKMSVYTYEQKTPVSIESAARSSIRQAITHANSKHSEIAFIFDKHSLFHRQDIEDGMKYYQSKYHKWKTKGVKAVVVMNAQHQVFEHHFDE